MRDEASLDDEAGERGLQRGMNDDTGISFGSGTWVLE